MHQCYIMCMSPSSLGNCTIYSTWCIMICLVIPTLSLLLFIQSLYSLSRSQNFFTCLLSFLAAFSNNYKAVIGLLQRLVIFRSERVNETIVVHYNSELNILFHCVCYFKQHLYQCMYMYMYIVMSYVRTELKGLTKKYS